MQLLFLILLKNKQTWNVVLRQASPDWRMSLGFKQHTYARPFELMEWGLWRTPSLVSLGTRFHLAGTEFHLYLNSHSESPRITWRKKKHVNKQQTSDPKHSKPQRVPAPMSWSGRARTLSWTRLNSPVYDETFVGSLLIADGADPGGLLFVHLQVEGGVEALQVRAGDCPARHRQPHLPQLREQKRSGQAGPETGPKRKTWAEATPRQLETETTGADKDQRLLTLLRV